MMACPPLPPPAPIDWATMPEAALPNVRIVPLLTTVTVLPSLPVPPKPPTATCTFTLGFFGAVQLPICGALGMVNVHEVASCSDSELAPPPAPPPPPIDCARMPLDPPP